MIVIEPGRSPPKCPTCHGYTEAGNGSDCPTCSPPPECPACDGIGGVPMESGDDPDIDDDSDETTAYVVCPDCGGTGRKTPEVPMTCTAPEF